MSIFLTQMTFIDDALNQKSGLDWIVYFKVQIGDGPTSGNALFCILYIISHIKERKGKKIIKKKIQPKAFVQFQWTCGMEQVHQIFKQFLQTHKLDKTSKVRQPLNQSISRPCCSLLDPVTDFYCILFKYEIWRETSAIRISSKMMIDQLGVLNHTAI